MKPSKEEFEDIFRRSHQITWEMREDQRQAQKVLHRWLDRGYAKLGKGLKIEYA